MQYEIQSLPLMQTVNLVFFVVFLFFVVFFSDIYKARQISYCSIEIKALALMQTRSANYFFPDILSVAVAYLCVFAVQHFLNDPHGKINTSNNPVPVPFIR